MSRGNANEPGRRVVILGGTGEARELAQALVTEGYAVTSSLAGRTNTPVLPAGKVRMGGFGGLEGLAAYLGEHGTDLLIDATHPFAAAISANAVAAAAKAGIPLIRIERPRWVRPEGAVWIKVPDMNAAASSLPAGARAFLTVGRQELAPFFSRADCSFVARMIDAPPDLPADWTVVRDRGPFILEREVELMRTHEITHLVSKNSGGMQTAAKLDAAARLQMPVIMVERPAVPEAETAGSVAEALAIIARVFRTG